MKNHKNQQRTATPGKNTVGGVIPAKAYALFRPFLAADKPRSRSGNGKPATRSVPGAFGGRPKFRPVDLRKIPLKHRHRAARERVLLKAFTDDPRKLDS